MAVKMKMEEEMMWRVQEIVSTKSTLRSAYYLFVFVIVYLSPTVNDVLETSLA